MNKSTTEIRQMFLTFFQNKGHKIIPGSSLIPNNDQTLLFTNAGMNQFKNIFLGLESINHSRITTAQHCIRAGGKHNDLKNVGYTNRHHTFFEMLGNFSFDDYFKQDAIKYAWELLTGKNWFNIPENRFWITTYHTDDESYNIWIKEIGIPEDRVIRIGDNKGSIYASDNFWQMGNTGPCGPCTEIFYDHGESIIGNLPGSVDGYGDRYTEIWNIVFMQFNRYNDGSLKLLSKPFVDTGMGLERISAVLQNVHSNYEIDIFRELIASISKLIMLSDFNNNSSNKSLRVIADHIRSSVFLISDGVFPSNEGRGYVLRRIIRRAIYHGYMIGVKGLFFYKLVKPLIYLLDNNKIESQQITIEKILMNEERQFLRILDRGIKLLDYELSQLQGDILTGEIVFLLYDTYGVPFDVTADICYERGIKFDELGFYAAMEQQKSKSRNSSIFTSNYNNIIKIDKNSDFSGYEKIIQRSKVTAIFKNDQFVNVLHQNENGIIICDKTCFYAESGGQVGDSGIISNNYFQFVVSDTKKYAKAIGHIGKLISGSISLNDLVNTQIDIKRRNAISINHSATHLLHAALRKVLGNHVIQQGSLVTDKYLRFDFNHFSAMTAIEIDKIENIVNYQIRKNHSIVTTLMYLEEAKEKGLVIFKNDRCNVKVRVLNIGDFSTELCCGTHANRTGDIGLFRINSESSIAAGIRRIEAVTGQVAIDLMRSQSHLLSEISKLINTDVNNLLKKIKVTLDKVKLLEKSLNELKWKQVAQKIISLHKQVKKINEVNLLITNVDNMDFNQLRMIVDGLKNKLKLAIIVLFTIYNGKVNITVGVTSNLSTKINANDLIMFVSQRLGGKGGGRADIAQCVISNITIVHDLLFLIEEWIYSRLRLMNK
ncbi:MULTISPECIES: alanine--tRNA ligase [Arsenophonus]|uniref:alanine--tRNA ligase n=1 Tax=Arsenophonus TaxID=637 RepID=UPI000829C71B|nr:alanine--tRNA ligase [Candidatus Arsenophonus lipoptenae]